MATDPTDDEIEAALNEAEAELALGSLQWHRFDGDKDDWTGMPQLSPQDWVAYAKPGDGWPDDYDLYLIVTGGYVEVGLAGYLTYSKSGVLRPNEKKEWMDRLSALPQPINIIDLEKLGLELC